MILLCFLLHKNKCSQTCNLEYNIFWVTERHFLPPNKLRYILRSISEFLILFNYFVSLVDAVDKFNICSDTQKEK